MSQIIVTVDNFQKICSREYWMNQSGERMFPHEFEDEHLANTIRFLIKMAHTYRLTEARNLCAVVYHTGNAGADPYAYYNAYKKQMNEFLGDLDDKQWLKENSKIHRMLVEEADYRKIDYSEIKQTKIKYTGKIKASYNDALDRFRYVFNS